MQSQCSRCVKVQACRNGLVRDMQPGRIQVREKNSRYDRASQQWLLYGPNTNSSLWANSIPSIESSSQLKLRPATCS